ncbi:MAG: hypothetical protein ABSD29_20590 [Verrucomicrobiota bacterium]|jgi:hypothetical protein
MNLLPVIERELRVRAKGRGTYWTRFVVAMVGLLVCLPLLTLGEGIDPALAGRFGFNCMVTAAFLLSCASCLLTADVISAERREGTLGLLFLTRLSGFEILLGKLASAGLAAACGLVAFLPVLMLPLLAGGVTGGEALRSALVLLDTLFLALAAGLWASVREQESVRAALRALLLTALLVLLPAMLEGMVRFAEGFTSGIGLLSPLVTIFDADATTGPEVARYWISLVLVQGLAWVLLARADMKLRDSLREDAPDRMPLARVAKAGLAAAAARRGDPPGDGNPIEWLVRRQPGIRTTLWAVGILSIAYSTFKWLLYRTVGFPTPGFVGLLMWPVGLAVSLTVEGVVARAASRFFFEARRTGQLELLLTTPYGAQAILSGQWRALSRLLRWPIGLAILFGLVREISTLAQTEALTNSGHFWSVIVPVICLLEVAGAVGGVVTACWLGMWFGIRGHTPLATMARAAGLTAGVPFLFETVVTFGLTVPVARLVGGHDLELWLKLAWGTRIIVLCYYGWLIRRTRRHLLAELSGSEPARWR